MSLEYWASYLPDLICCLMNTSNAVLEIGAGKWSTPILDSFCKAASREFVSIDSDPEWCIPPAKWADFDVEIPKLAERSWSVVFLDHDPSTRRAPDAMLFKGKSEYVICHDFAEEIAAGFEPILNYWPHRKISTRFSPKTLVLGMREIPRS